MIEAGLWGLLGGSSLLIGAALGLRARIPDRVRGLLLGFGAGTLISALAFELTEDALKLGGADIVAAGLGVGSVTYFVCDRALEGRGAGARMQADVEPPEGSGIALLLGAVLDGIPESAVIGITVLAEGTVALPVLAAVFLSNLPEAIGSATSMRRTPARLVMAMWLAVTIACAASAALGYGLLDGASGDIVGFIEAFAGGAVLMTVADAMLPDAQRFGGKAVGLATVLGFAVAALLSSVG